MEFTKWAGLKKHIAMLGSQAFGRITLGDNEAVKAKSMTVLATLDHIEEAMMVLELIEQGVDENEAVAIAEQRMREKETRRIVTGTLGVKARA